MKAIATILVLSAMLLGACSRDTSSRRAWVAVRQELRWIDDNLLGEAVEIPEWSSIFRNARAVEIKTGVHGLGVFCVSSRVNPEKIHVFYDTQSISPAGRSAPSEAEADERLRKKVEEFNQTLGSDLQIGGMNKYIFASILSRCLFEERRGVIGGLGVLNEEMTEPTIRFDPTDGGYVFRLFHSYDREHVRYWVIKTKDGGHIQHWTVRSEPLRSKPSEKPNQSLQRTAPSGRG